MISQRCPKCHSNRIRRGYRPTPIWSKVLFRYNLLCDSCNWEFTGFAVPGTVSVKPNRKTKKRSTREEPEADTKFDVEHISVKEELENSQMGQVKKKKIKKTFVF